MDKFIAVLKNNISIKSIFFVFLIFTIGIKFYNKHLEEENENLRIQIEEARLLKYLTNNYYKYAWIIGKNIEVGSHVEGVRLFKYMSYDKVREFFYENYAIFEFLIENRDQMENNLLYEANEMSPFGREIESERKILEDKFNAEFKDSIMLILNSDYGATFDNGLHYGSSLSFPGKMEFAYYPSGEIDPFRDAMVINSKWVLYYKRVSLPLYITDRYKNITVWDKYLNEFTKFIRA